MTYYNICNGQPLVSKNKTKYRRVISGKLILYLQAL